MHHLGAPVIYIELPVNIIAGPLKESGKRITKRPAPSVGNGYRAGRVCRDKLHLHFFSATNTPLPIRAVIKGMFYKICNDFFFEKNVYEAWADNFDLFKY
ncbi:MAG: hypothetical protein BWX90_00508 [bacterium ADurb.Bin132]|nr:MAG: hypothetical protein BWX90_00508 [bacterium ADurb.Bin132]